MTRTAETESKLTHEVPMTEVAAPALTYSPSLEITKRGLFWEELYRSAPADRHFELLQLAQSQGFLYTHQVPNGCEPNASDLLHEPAWLTLVGKMLEQRLEGLKRPTCESVALCDQRLDAMQRFAVHGALSTPDLFLIAGFAGTGKSTVVSEIIRQATGRDERVLLVAGRGVEVDHLLHAFEQDDFIYPLRLVDSRESVDRLDRLIANLTLRERGRHLKEHTLQKAREAKRQAERRCHNREQEEAVWSELVELVGDLEEHRSRVDAMERQIDEVAKTVRDEASALQRSIPDRADGEFAGCLAALLKEEERALAEIEKEQAEIEETCAEKEAAVADLNRRIDWLRPLVDAKRQVRWWTVAWWRALFAGDVQGRLDDLVKQRDDTLSEASVAMAAKEEIAHRAAEAKNMRERAFEERIAEEVDHRRQCLAEELTRLQTEHDRQVQRWYKLVARLEFEQHRPEDVRAACIDAAQSLWQEQCAKDQEHCHFAGQWAAFVEQTLDGLSEHLLSLANVVAGSWKSLDETPPGTSEPYDLIVVEGAHELDERSFVKLARRGRRCVLVGEPGGEPEGLFSRLWESLHCDPSDRPYEWRYEEGRLCCRLVRVKRHERKWLETEQLADSPEIELRIFTPPNGAAVLAEVVFPESTSIVEAKRRILQELDELALQPRGHNLLVTEDDSCFRLWFGQLESAADAHAVELSRGLREIASTAGKSTDVTTCRFEFDKEAGWTEEEVESWIGQHIGERLGRTCYLQFPYRMRPALAEVIADLLFPGGYHSLTDQGETGLKPLVFVPVPPLSERNGNASEGRGAGLEIDLGGRQSNQLPADLRARLPNKGFVNVAEAEAVVEQLEAIAEGAGWSTKPRCCVAAMYPGQVELIRCFMERSERLKDFEVEVGLPSDFRQREFSVVLVSLTRSDSRRPISAGKLATQLHEIITRASHQVYLVGDPGTLMMSCQGRGSGRSSRPEEPLVANLVRYLRGEGKHAEAFSLCESVR